MQGQRVRAIASLERRRHERPGSPPHRPTCPGRASPPAASRSAIPAWARIRCSASAGGVPRAARRSRCAAGSQVTSQTSSHSAGEAALDELDRLDDHGRARPRPRRHAIASRIRGRTAGWTIASRSRSAAGSANTSRPRAAPVERAVRGRHRRPEPLQDRRVRRRAGRRDVARDPVRVHDPRARAPRATAATWVLPHPIGPVIPIRTVRAVRGAAPGPVTDRSRRHAPRARAMRPPPRRGRARRRRARS